jgi:DNA-directed RNA polymerase specialized sigma24 family protein
MTKKTKAKAAAVAKPAKKKYLNNKDMLAEIHLSREREAMTPNLAKMLMLLCYRYSQKPEFANYSYNEDMRAFALLTACKVWKSFDPARSSNPFAYFTTVFTHSFYQQLNYEKKQRNIRDELLISNGDNPSFNYMDSDDGDDNYSGGDYYNKLINSPTEEDEPR